MHSPLTADQRESRIAAYLRTLNKGELAEFQLTRLNRVANFRKELMHLLENFVEARAEILAAGMLMESAQPRPASQLRAIAKPRPKRRQPRKMPAWLRNSSNLINH